MQFDFEDSENFAESTSKGAKKVDNNRQDTLSTKKEVSIDAKDHSSLAAAKKKYDDIQLSDEEVE